MVLDVSAKGGFGLNSIRRLCNFSENVKIRAALSLNYRHVQEFMPKMYFGLTFLDILMGKVHSWCGHHFVLWGKNILHSLQILYLMHPTPLCPFSIWNWEWFLPKELLLYTPEGIFPISVRNCGFPVIFCFKAAFSVGWCRDPLG